MKVVYVFGGIIILKTTFYENEYSIVDLLSKSQFAMFYERHRPQARIVLWTNHHHPLPHPPPIHPFPSSCSRPPTGSITFECWKLKSRYVEGRR